MEAAPSSSDDPVTVTLTSLDQELQYEDDMKQSLSHRLWNNTSNVMTRSRLFQTLLTKSYAVCDADGTGHITQSELYAGLLLVHLNLAKYAGPAACYPPTRELCNELFEAADKDDSGGIDESEFVKIMTICCAQILSRILVYYCILILFVPSLAQWAIDSTDLVNGTIQEMAAEQCISIGIFFIFIPFLWNHIDRESKRELVKTKQDEVVARKNKKQAQQATCDVATTATAATAASGKAPSGLSKKSA